GLTVLAELLKAYPKHSFLYLGDTARVPYGTRSSSLVIRYALEATWFLTRYPLDCLVIGCNTVSAVAIPSLRAANPNVAILDVITPGAQSAVESTVTGKIMVLATEGTIASRAYEKAIHALEPEAEVIGIPCPLLVSLAEEGITKGEIPESIIRHYISKKLDEEIDTIVLGCTHFPLFRNTVQAIVGDKIKVVDSTGPLVKKLKTYLTPIGDSTKQRLRMFTTDLPERFMKIGVTFLERPIDEPTLLDLESMFYRQYHQYKDEDY
ncbi:MAG TPA: glutamate racemase, partial [Planctomycetota bacterium]|nr:glutamate racemase [Planctomycetota bacterium]